MRRGERKLWRAVAETATQVASSTNYAEEYIYGSEFSKAMGALLAFGRAPDPAVSSFGEGEAAE